MSAETIFAAFNRCREWLIPALEDVTEDDLLNELLLGRAQLWAGDECAVVTQSYRPTKSLHVWLAGGRLRDVLALFPGAVAWARPLGHVQMTCEGRKGWTRALRAIGFEGDDMLVREI